MRHFDIIVIGSGIAGLNFALRAAEQKRHVLVITKKLVANASTNFAQGGIAAVLSILDDYKKHVRDTLIAGSFHNNKRAVAYMVRHGPLAISRLIDLGVPFATQEGSLLLAREGGHSERRIAFVSDYTGQAIEKVLVSQVRRNPYITLLEHTFAGNLLVKNKVCYGVQVIREPAFAPTTPQLRQGFVGLRRATAGRQEFENIYGKIIVLATGGIGQLYENTTNPAISTGDGLAMAFRAGCELRDLEFIQFHPSALKLKGKPCFLISEAVRGEGAYLMNSDGKRFMKKYHKLAELAPRDIVSRAIFEEEKKGRVFLDLRDKKAAYIKTRFPMIYQTLKKYGIDMTKQLIPISPAAHYLCGGIKVNLRGETGIKNLYAFGEVAGTGVHGANRLASNSLLEALVFSDRIFGNISALGTTGRKKSRPRFFAPTLTPLLKHDKKVIADLRKKLQYTMWENVGIIRSTKSLEKAALTLKNLSKNADRITSNAPKVFELKNMILVAELITKAALARRKSLGCHYRVG